jgi:hypothetical protein
MIDAALMEVRQGSGAVRGSGYKIGRSDKAYGAKYFYTL